MLPSSVSVVFIACSLSHFRLIILNVIVKPNEDSTHPAMTHNVKADVERSKKSFNNCMNLNVLREKLNVQV